MLIFEFDMYDVGMQACWKCENSIVCKSSVNLLNILSCILNFHGFLVRYIERVCYLRRGHVSCFSIIVIVIMISAMLIFQFCPKLQDKHCIKHYDYDRKIRYKIGPLLAKAGKLQLLQRKSYKRYVFNNNCKTFLYTFIVFLYRCTIYMHKFQTLRMLQRKRMRTNNILLSI